MEPISALLLVSMPTLIAGIVLFLHRKRSARAKAINVARKRAQQRIKDREFAEEPSDSYLLSDNVNYVTVNGINVIEDGFNSHGIALSQEQMYTIGLIFQGYKAQTKHRTVNTTGPSVHMVSGIPLNLSALDNQNRVDDVIIADFLDPALKLPEPIVRG